MKRFFTFLFFISSAPSHCMELAKPKKTTVILQAFTQEKEFFVVPHHIAHMCKTLQNPLTDLHQEQKHVVFQTDQSAETIKGTLECLMLAHRLQKNENEFMRKKIFEYFLNQFASNENQLVSITHLIHYLDPQDYGYQLDTNIPQISHIQEACKEALMSSAINAQAHKPNPFMLLNPNISPENVSLFLEETSFISDVLHKYINRPLPETNKKHIHPLLNKRDFELGDSLEQDIIKILYCTDKKVVYALKNPQHNDHITLLKQTHKKVKSKNTPISIDSIAQANDSGTIFMFTNQAIDKNKFHIYNTKPLGVQEYINNTSGCINNKNVYFGTNDGIVHTFNDATLKEICTTHKRAAISQIATNVYDSTLAFTSDRYLYIAKRPAETQLFSAHRKIDLEDLLELSSHSFKVEKITLNSNGDYLYLVTKHSNGDIYEYIYTIDTERLLCLGSIPHDYTLLNTQWTPSFIIRAYTSSTCNQPITYYTLSHIDTGKSCTKTVYKPFEYLTRKGAAYIEKEVIDEKTTYYSVPIIDEGLEKLGLFFTHLSSFTITLLIDRLLKNTKVALDDYDYHLYQELPTELKNILTVPEKK